MKLSFKTKQKGLPFLKTAARVANVIQRRRPQRHSHHVGDNHNYGTTGDERGEDACCTEIQTKLLRYIAIPLDL